MRKKRICVDFDGVIADYTQGALGVGMYGSLLPGAAEALHRLKSDGWHIVICTARHNTDIPLIRRYLDKHDIPYDRVTTRKPRTHAYVDDRAIRFDGDWQQTLQEILEFEPYYYRQEQHD